MLPVIGSVRALPEQGRFGVVVSAQPLGEARDGRQLTALKIKENAQSQGSIESSFSSSTSAPDARPSYRIDRSPQTGNLDQPSSVSAKLPADLTAAERADVTRLQQRDQQVRQEEKAHAAVAGDLAGPINYAYQRGPDGRQYAVGGSVGIQASNPSGDPDEAKRIGARMAAAANAATNPSAHDYTAARQAYAFGSELSEPLPKEDQRAGLNLTL